MVVEQDERPPEDGVRAAQGEVRVGEVLDGVPEVAFSAGDADRARLADEVPDLAPQVPASGGAVAAVVGTDPVGIVRAPRAQAPARPIEKVLAWRSGSK